MWWPSWSTPSCDDLHDLHPHVMTIMIYTLMWWPSWSTLSCNDHHARMMTIMSCDTYLDDIHPHNAGNRVRGWYQRQSQGPCCNWWIHLQIPLFTEWRGEEETLISLVKLIQMHLKVANWLIRVFLWLAGVTWLISSVKWKCLQEIFKVVKFFLQFMFVYLF